jgi:hypothetical protein
MKAENVLRLGTPTTTTIREVRSKPENALRSAKLHHHPPRHYTSTSSLVLNLFAWKIRLHKRDRNMTHMGI